MNIFPENVQKSPTRFRRRCGIMGAENLQEVRIKKHQFANELNDSVNDTRSECTLSYNPM